MSEQPLLEVRRLVKHFRAGGGWFKSAAAFAVIGVGHVAFFYFRCEVQEHMQPVLLALGAQPGKIVVVVRIHGEQVIETPEVGGLGLTGALAGKINPSFAGRCLGAFVRRVADVPTAGAGRIHRYLAAQPLALHQCPENPLGRGRTADVPETDK